MAEEVNIIIDNLCTKFGTTVQTLVPEMAKMNISEGIVTIIICVIILIFLYKASVKIWNYSKKYDSEYGLLLLVTGFAAVIFTIILSITIVSTTGWITSPTAKTIGTIISMVD